MRHVPARFEQPQPCIPFNAVGTLRAAKLAAQERLDAGRKLSIAQSEFQKISKAECAAVLAFVEAYDNATERRHG